jgi:hypothetical protein
MIEVANFLDKTSEIWVALINGIFLLISIKIGSGIADKWINSNQNLNNNNNKQETKITFSIDPRNIPVKPSEQDINEALTVAQPSNEKKDINFSIK